MSTTATLQRSRRAAVAQRVVGHDAAAGLDWDALDRAPDWLALPDAAFAVFQRRVGAVLEAQAIQLWIDGPRIAAARAALGEAFLAKLLTRPAAAAAVPSGLVGGPRIDSAAQVAPLLQAAGASVLLASLSHGPLRRAAAALLAPATASSMAHELATALVARTRALEAETAGATP